MTVVTRASLLTAAVLLASLSFAPQAWAFSGIPGDFPSGVLSDLLAPTTPEITKGVASGTALPGK